MIRSTVALTPAGVGLNNSNLISRLPQYSEINMSLQTVHTFDTKYELARSPKVVHKKNDNPTFPFPQLFPTFPVFCQIQVPQKTDGPSIPSHQHLLDLNHFIDAFDPRGSHFRFVQRQCFWFRRDAPGVFHNQWLHL